MKFSSVRQPHPWSNPPQLMGDSKPWLADAMRTYGPPERQTTRLMAPPPQRPMQRPWGAPQRGMR